MSTDTPLEPPAPAAPIGPFAPAPRRAPWPRPALTPLGVGALGAMVASAVIADIALRAGVATVAAPLGVVLAGGALWWAGELATVRARLLVAGAVLVAVWLPLRASEPLAALNTLTAVGLLTAAAVFGRHRVPGPSRAALGAFVRRSMGWRFAPRLAAVTTAQLGAGHRSAALVRGLVLAVAPVVVLGALLASADAVFASLLSPGWKLDSVVAHVAVVGVIATGLLCLICVARTESDEDRSASDGEVGPLGGVEALVVFTSVALLFALFAIAQFVGALGGADRILSEQGLTRAEYARSGFFQLLWVAALTLALVVLVDAWTRPASARVAVANRLASATVAQLTVLIVAVAILRLGLYTDAYGQTLLRWYSTAFAWFIGALFLLLTVRQLVDRPRQGWFGPACVGLAVATLIGVNVVNPERRVAEHNLGRTASEVPLDVDYLTGLSADAWPALLDRLPPDEIDIDRCRRAAEPGGYGILGLNLARTRLTC